MAGQVNELENERTPDILKPNAKRHTVIEDECGL